MSENDLPEGWADVAVDEVCRSVTDGDHQAPPKADSGVPFITISALNDGQLRLDKATRFVPPSYYHALKPERRADLGDVLYSVTGSIGIPALVDTSDAFVFQRHIAILKPASAKIDNIFLRYRLEAEDIKNQGKEVATGTAQLTIPLSGLRAFRFGLPPLPEQRRIVEKVEALLAEVSHAKGHLERVRTILKRFRQSVLAAACSGKLTEEWRERHQFTSDEWPTMKLTDLCSAVVDCPHSTPKWSDKGRMCLRTTNFQAQGLDLNEVRYVSDDTYRERIARLEPVPGDIVYSREGGILGIACLIPAGLQACLGQRMMLMRPDRKLILPQFLTYVLNAPATLAVVKELTGGTAAPHLNVADIKAFDIPTPPLDEQREALRRIDSLTVLSSEIETRLRTATVQVDRLPQAILSKAFSGELVPTEAELARAEGHDYEPASELLKRIKNQGDATSKAKQPKRGRSKTVLS